MFFRLTIVAAVAALTAGLAGAQTVGRVGVFAVDKISEKGKFDRCALTLEPGPSMLRISWNKNHVYAMSVPSAPKAPGAVVMTLDLGRLGVFKFPATVMGPRTSAVLDNRAVDKLMEARKQIKVNMGSAQYVWQIDATNMGDAFRKLEDCVWKAHGR